MKITRKSGQVTAILNGKVGVFTISPYEHYNKVDSAFILTDINGEEYEVTDYQDKMDVYESVSDDGSTIYVSVHILSETALASFPNLPDVDRLAKNASNAVKPLLDSVIAGQTDADDLKWAATFIARAEYLYTTWLHNGTEELSQATLIKTIFGL